MVLWPYRAVCTAVGVVGVMLAIMGAVVEGAIGTKDTTTEDVHDLIYTGWNGDPCVLIMDKDGQYGCTTEGRRQVSGELFLVESQEDVDRFANGGNGIVVLDSTLFFRDTIDTLKRGDLTGIIVLEGPPPPAGSSSDETVPNSKWNTWSSYEWNPLGDSLIFQSFNFPMWFLSSSSAESIRSVAKYNRDNDKYPKWGAGISTFMYGADDTITCLRRGLCLPLGGKSIWSTLEPLSSKAPKPIILVTSTIDSTSMFHNHAPGMGNIAGVIALVSAELALKQVKAELSNLPYDIVFAIFNGETYGYLGSRKLVHDLQNFECQQYDNEIYGQCNDPFAVSTEFTKIKLDNIKMVIDIGQIGQSLTQDKPNIWLYQTDNQDDTNRIINILSSQSNDNYTFTAVGLNSPTGNQVPPTPATPFLQQNPALPTVILADHSSAFATTYYHSQFDRSDFYNLTDISVVTNYTTNTTSNTTNTTTAYSSLLCSIATSVSRALFTIAWNNTNGAEPPAALLDSINADCELVAQLWQCLTVDWKCPLIQSLLGTLSGSATPSYYVGVFGYSATSYFISLPVTFIFNLLYWQTASLIGQNCTEQSQCPYGWTCAGDPTGPRCMQASVFYHDAISPAFEYDTGSSEWKIVNLSEPTWAEADWGGLYMQIFLVDDPVREWVFLILGCLALAGLIVSVFLLRRLLPKRFKLA